MMPYESATEHHARICKAEKIGAATVEQYSNSFYITQDYPYWVVDAGADLPLYELLVSSHGENTK